MRYERIVVSFVVSHVKGIEGMSGQSGQLGIEEGGFPTRVPMISSSKQLATTGFFPEHTRVKERLITA